MSPKQITLHDPLEAARRLGHEHGIATIARKLGMNERVLAHQLNPEQEFHKLGLATAIAITEHADDNSILDAWAAQRGLICVPVPQTQTTDEELLDDCMNLTVTQGDFGRVLIGARKDGVIDAGEYQIMATILRKLMAQAALISGELAGQVRELPQRKTG